MGPDPLALPRAGWPMSVGGWVFSRWLRVWWPSEKRVLAWGRPRHTLLVQSRGCVKGPDGIRDGLLKDLFVRERTNEGGVNEK